MSIAQLVQDGRRITVLAIVEATAKPASIGWVALFIVILQVSFPFASARAFPLGFGIRPLEPFFSSPISMFTVAPMLLAFSLAGPNRSLLLSLPVRGYIVALAKFLGLWLQIAIVLLIDLAVVIGFNALLVTAPLQPGPVSSRSVLSNLPVAAVLTAAFLLLLMGAPPPPFYMIRKLGPAIATVVSSGAQIVGLAAMLIAWYVLMARLGFSGPLPSLIALGLLLSLAGVVWERTAEDVPHVAGPSFVGTLPMAPRTQIPLWELFRIQSRAGASRWMMLTLLVIFEVVTLLTNLAVFHEPEAERVAGLFFPLGLLPILAIMLGLSDFYEQGYWDTNHLLLSLPVRGRVVVGARFLAFWVHLGTFAASVVVIALVVLFVRTLVSPTIPAATAAVVCGIFQGALLLPPAMLLSSLGFLGITVWRGCRSWSPPVRLALVLAIIGICAFSGLNPWTLGFAEPVFGCGQESAAPLATHILATTISALIALAPLVWVTSVLWERVVEA
jgi:hypothetical protein